MVNLYITATFIAGQDEGLLSISHDLGMESYNGSMPRPNNVKHIVDRLLDSAKKKWEEIMGNPVELYGVSVSCDLMDKSGAHVSDISLVPGAA